MFEAIQSGGVCVQMVSAYAYFEAPSVATKISAVRNLAARRVDHRHRVAAVVMNTFSPARCTWRIKRASVLRYS
jgi:hypothetical protein